MLGLPASPHDLVYFHHEGWQAAAACTPRCDVNVELAVSLGESGCLTHLRLNR